MLKTLEFRIRKQKKTKNSHNLFEMRLQKLTETRARKLDKKKKKLQGQRQKKSRSSGSETLADLYKKIEKETKLK